ncbi:hypothetical protein DYH09_23475 [bacterium CPR1]|nr:hypothetical protein [bacterium CPR1]
MIQNNFNPALTTNFIGAPSFTAGIGPSLGGHCPACDGHAGSALLGNNFGAPNLSAQQLPLLLTLMSLFAGMSGAGQQQNPLAQFGQPQPFGPQNFGQLGMPQFGGMPQAFAGAGVPGAQAFAGIGPNGMPFANAFAGLPGGGGFPGMQPGFGQGFSPGMQGPGSIQQLIANPKSLGPGAGMKMLPPNAPPEAFKQALEQRFGMPFEQIRQQYAQGKQDPKLKNPKAINKVGPAELYKQMMVESEFGKIGMKGHDGQVGGRGKLSGTRKSMAQVNDSYANLYQAKGGQSGAGAAAEGAGGSAMAMSLAVTFMNSQGIPMSLAISVAMAESGQGCSGGGGVQDQAAYAKAKASYEAAVKSGTPILLDLAGDGVPPVEEGEWKPHPHKFSAKNKRMFDLDADGVKELVEWVNPGGALLCQPDDKQDVPNGKHLFGDAGGFKDGYSKLAKLDTEEKGFVSLADMEKNNIHVWVDETGDALVTEGEIKTCRELGISKIYTAHTDYKSTFVQDGQEKATWDWWPSYRKLAVGARA